MDKYLVPMSEKKATSPKDQKPPIRMLVGSMELEDNILTYTNGRHKAKLLGVAFRWQNLFDEKQYEKPYTIDLDLASGLVDKFPLGVHALSASALAMLASAEALEAVSLGRTGAHSTRFSRSAQTPMAELTAAEKAAADDAEALAEKHREELEVQIIEDRKKVLEKEQKKADKRLEEWKQKETKRLAAKAKLDAEAAQLKAEYRARRAKAKAEREAKASEMERKAAAEHVLSGNKGSGSFLKSMLEARPATPPMVGLPPHVEKIATAFAAQPTHPDDLDVAKPMPEIDITGDDSDDDETAPKFVDSIVPKKKGSTKEPKPETDFEEAERALFDREFPKVKVEKSSIKKKRKARRDAISPMAIGKTNGKSTSPQVKVESPPKSPTEVPEPEPEYENDFEETPEVPATP